MTPLTLHVRCERFLQEFVRNIPNDKELHLLIDVFRMEEHPHTIFGGKRTIFDYLIFEDEVEREKFFDNFQEYRSYYSPTGITNKLSPLAIQTKIENAGFNRITKKMIQRFGNPVKLRIRLDKFANKQLRRYEL